MVQRFIKAAEDLAEIVARDGCVMKPYFDASVPVFTALPPLEAANALSRIEGMLEACRLVHTRGQTLDNSRALLEAFLETSDLTTEPDVLDQIEEEHTVELYSANQKLLCASLKSFRVVSYSLEDLFCKLWYEVLSRDIMGITEALTKVAVDILTENVTSIIYTGSIPDHVCREVSSIEKRSIIIFHHLFAPLRKHSKVIGFLCVNQLFPYEEAHIED